MAELELIYRMLLYTPMMSYYVDGANRRGVTDPIDPNTLAASGGVLTAQRRGLALEEA